MARPDKSIESKAFRQSPRPHFSWFGRLVRAFGWLCVCIVLALGAFVLSFILFPPFGNRSTARVMMVGLDDKTPDESAQRSDSLILLATKLHGGGATLLSVPRDARVRLPGEAHSAKINAAYAKGKQTLLEETLAEPELLHDHITYYLIYDSASVAAIVDAIGGVYVDVPRDMNYDDSWSGLHIHLDKGKHQLLIGKDIVGFLRWRKNNDGSGASDDFERTERQRQFLVAFKDKLTSWQGICSLPKIYSACKQTVNTNLSLTQLLALGWSSRQITTETVPGTPRTIGGVSYVVCNWGQARKLWALAIQ